MKSREDLGRDDFVLILEKYDIGEFVSFDRKWSFSGDIMYIVHTNLGRYIVKVFDSMQKDYLQFQIRIMEFVIEKGLPVPKIVKMRAGRTLSSYNSWDILISEFKGDEFSSFSDSLIRDVAKKHALIDESCMRLKLYYRHTRGNYLFESFGLDIEPFEGFNVNLEEESVLRAMRGMNRHFIRRSVINTDFHPANFMLVKDKLSALFDWGTVYEDYMVYGIAIIFGYSFVNDKRVDVDSIRLYLKEYQKIVEINDEEKEVIYYFIKKRFLIGIYECLKQLGSVGHNDELENYLRYLISKYKVFSAFDFDDFLGLFD